MFPNIRIANLSPRTATIDIEGIIGTDETLQFEEAGSRVATYEKFRIALDQISQRGTPRVVVNIRSAGGDVNDALLIHDALAALPTRITTRCYGYVASAATIIAQAASKGRREISSNALYLIHNSVSRAEGNSRTVGQTLELLCKTDERIAAVYAARSGREQDEFLELMNENGGNGRWLSPEEAVRYGLVDRIVDAAPISNHAAEQLHALGLPGIPDQAPLPHPGPGGKWEKLLSVLGIGEHVEERTPHVSGEEKPQPETDKQTNSTPDIAAIPVNKTVPDPKAAVLPTATLQKEDPSAAEGKLSPNRSAYEQDVRNFR